MKRMITLALTVLLIAAIFVTPAVAAEETYTVSIDIVASLSNAKTQTFVAYFQNIETGEMLICLWTVIGRTNTLPTVCLKASTVWKSAFCREMKRSSTKWSASPRT
jgi:hypothetical protein